jgi:hypothetical protein
VWGSGRWGARRRDQREGDGSRSDGTRGTEGGRRIRGRGRADAACGTDGGCEARGADPSQGSEVWAVDPRELMEPGGRNFFSSSFFLVVEISNNGLQTQCCRSRR